MSTPVFLLLNSPIYLTSIQENVNYLSPLGLGYLATALKEAGILVEFIDCVKKQYGVDETINEINRKHYDYVGINIFTQNFDVVKKIIEESNQDTRFVIGGPAIKFLYKKILEWQVTQKIIIVVGEAELILPSIVNNCCRQKPTISQSNKKVYFINKNSEYFPADLSQIRLDRTFFQDDIIINHFNQKEIAIITSRGCPFNCAFCGGAKSLNDDISIRKRCEQDIITEINNIVVNSPEVESIRILDDLFLQDIKRMESAIRIFSQFENLTWRAMVHAISIGKGVSLLDDLKSSGCKELFIGIESGSNKIREKINKVGTSEQVYKIITEILLAGIDVKGYFIYGFPDETLEDSQKTFALAKRIKEFSRNTSGKFRTSVFQFRPYDGTALYEEIKQKNKKIKSILPSEHLNVEGRSQFNFDSGNYSEIPDEMLIEFVMKTQMLE